MSSELRTNKLRTNKLRTNKLRTNKERVQFFFDTMWSDPDAARELATDDVTWVTTRGMPIPGAEGIEHVGWDAVMHVATSGLKIDTGYIPETMEYPYRRFFEVEDDNVIFRFTMKCTTKAGRDYVNDYLFFVEMRDGKIARFQEYWDSKQAFDILLAGNVGADAGSASDRWAETADVVEITQLLYRYHDAVDTKEWDAFGRILTPDAECSWPGLGAHTGTASDSPVGRDEVVAWLRVAGGERPTVHHMLNAICEVDGEAAAVRSNVAVRGRDGVMIDAGSYTGRCVRTPEGWRIRSLTFTHRLH